MKILLFAMGPGESSHAYAMARYFTSKKHQVIVALGQHINNALYQGAHFLDLIITPGPGALRKLVNADKPDVVLLCNSKSFNSCPSFVEHRPWAVPTFSIDSNWLFEATGPTRCIQWLDGYFAAFPPHLFSLGFQENGGHFAIPPDMLSRIIPVGFVPSYRKPDEEVCSNVRECLNLSKDEKLIFCYISGRGAGIKHFVLDSIFQVVQRLRYIGYKIRVYVVGNLDIVGHRFPCSIADWLIFRELACEDFYAHVASADLVFQHQGLATLAQAISAQVPVITNIVQPPHPESQLHHGEMHPFERAGLCKIFFDYSPLEDIQQSVEALLYDEQARALMQQMHRDYACRGEQKIYETLLETL